MTAIVASTAPPPSLPAAAGGAPQGESGAFGNLLAALDSGTAAETGDDLAAATVTATDLANLAAQSDDLDAAQAAAMAAAQAAAANLLAAMSPPVAQTSLLPVLAEDADKTGGSDAAAVSTAVPGLAAPSLDLAGKDLVSPMGEDSILATARSAANALSALNVDLAPVPAESTPAPQPSRAAETVRPPAAPAQAAAPASPTPPALAALPEVVSVVGVIVAPAAPKAEVAPAPVPADAMEPAAVATVVAQPVPSKPPVKTPDDKAANPRAESPLAPAHQSVTAVQAQGSSDANAGDGNDDKAPLLKVEDLSAPEAVTKDAAVFAPTQPAAASLATTPVATARVTPETVAHLSAEIARKTDSKSTRFDIVLTPEGLGRVDVRVEIAADGKLSAALSFDNAQAASDLRGKAGELRQALSLAGFDVADNALKFDMSGSGGQNGQPGQGGLYDFQNGENGRRAFQGRAFQAAANEDLPPLTAADLPPGLRMAAASGLDVRI